MQQQCSNRSSSSSPSKRSNNHSLLVLSRMVSPPVSVQSTQLSGGVAACAKLGQVSACAADEISTAALRPWLVKRQRMDGRLPTAATQCSLCNWVHAPPVRRPHHLT